MEAAAPAVELDHRITAYGLMLEANRRLEREFARSLRDEHGMAMVTFEALLRLARSDGQLSMTELAEQMVLSSGGVTRLIDRLSDAGLAERLQCAEDRRVQWAHITDEGRQILDAALETHLVDLERHFTGLIDGEEMDVLTSVMDRLRTSCGAAPATD